MRWMVLLATLVLACADDPATDAGPGNPRPGAGDAAVDLDGRTPDFMDGGASEAGREADATTPVPANDGSVSPTAADADCIEDQRQLFYETPDPTRAFFNPNEIYLLGTLSPGSCGADGVAPVSQPNLPLVGFGCVDNGHVIRPSDRRLLYLDSDAGVRLFHCDGCTYAHPQDRYPANTVANDELIATPGCTAQERVSFFRLSPEGNIIHRCGMRWLDSQGQALDLGGSYPLQYGYDGWLLLNDGLYSLKTGTSTAITGLPANAKWIANRATSTGFWLAVALTDANDPTELWQVDHGGVATRKGAYPAPPTNANISFILGEMSALDSAGRLSQIARDKELSPSDIIIRRSIEGASEVVYDERTRPLLQIHISSLVTGPGAAIEESRVWGGQVQAAVCKTRAEQWPYQDAQVPTPRPPVVPIVSAQPGAGVQCRNTRCQPGQPCCEDIPRFAQVVDGGTAECLAPDASIPGSCSPFDLTTGCDQSSDCPASADPLEPNVCCFSASLALFQDDLPHNRSCTTAAECAGSAFHVAPPFGPFVYSGVLACQTDADCTLAGPNSRCVSDGLVTGSSAAWPHVGRCEGTVKPPDGTTLLSSSVVCGETSCSREDGRVCCHRGSYDYAHGALTMDAPTCDSSCYSQATMRYAQPSACDEPADCVDPLASQAGDPFVCCVQRDLSGAPWARQCARRTQCSLFACRTDADCAEAGQGFTCRPERTLTGGGQRRPDVKTCQDR